MKNILLSALMATSLLLTGCSSSQDTSPQNSSVTQVIDVRTPDEYASGHVANAINIDAESSIFANQIAELDPEGVYLVYCRSGRRSAIAAQAMSEAGLTVLDGGGLDAMLNNGWELGQ